MAILRKAVLVALASGVSGSALAGVVVMRVAPGTCAGIATTGWSDGKCDSADGAIDGIIVFVVPQEIQASGDTFATCKEVVRLQDCVFCVQPSPPQTITARVYEVLKFRPEQGFTMAALEPFDLDAPVPVEEGTAVVALVEVPEYLAEGSPLAACQATPVVDGAVPETSRIRFKNGGSLASDPAIALQQVLDDTFVNALPNFSGEIGVCGADEFRPSANLVPSLGAWGILTSALALLAAMGWVLRRF